LNKCLAIKRVLVLLLTSLVALQPIIVEAQSSNQAPAIEWQKDYSKYDHVLESSNLIQTNDGGYAFMDIGYQYQEFVNGATIFKVDSKGNVQWTKNIPDFIGSTIIQTSDKGYEISGWWYATIESPTLIKTDSHGNIQWNQNYTTLPNLDNNYYNPNDMFPYAFGDPDPRIRTSDGGFASCGTNGEIVKTDSNNTTQWTETLTYFSNNYSPAYQYQHPIILTSIIETSDGAIAALGVAPLVTQLFLPWA